MKLTIGLKVTHRLESGHQRAAFHWIACAATVALTACGGGGGGDSQSGVPTGSPPSPTTFTASFQVAGLAPGKQVVLAFNAFSTAVSANGKFDSSFPPFYEGMSYEASVVTQPTSQVCAIANRRGTTSRANLTFAVTCAQTPETVLHAMRVADGNSTNSPLMQADDGNFYGTAPEGGAYGQGTVFRITPQGVFSVLYSFGGISQRDGLVPMGALVQGKNGHLYGTTSGGGVSNNNGTVFEMTLDGSMTILYTFGSKPYDAAAPQAGLILASDGNFYGTASVGGLHGGGAVFKATPAGDVTVLYSFGGIGSGDGANPTSALMQGADGNFYGTTEQGGATSPQQNYGTVYRVTPAGVGTVLYSFGATAGDGRFPQAGLVQSSDGNFYGTTLSGGANSSGTIFRLSPAGVFETFYSFGADLDDGRAPVGSLLVGPNGSLYGTTAAGGVGGGLAGGAVAVGTVFRVKPDRSGVVLYTFGVTNDGLTNDGTAPRAGLISGRDGNLWGITPSGGDFFGGVVFSISGSSL